VTLSLSILDLAEVNRDETVGEALQFSVRLAQHAERWGYHRVWYAEHHNMPTSASAATSVLIAHVAAQTGSIRLGAGGVMLPNHSPLTIAEQFGTLEALHPGRIDLGLGRAPGGDRHTFRALRRHPGTSDRFPDDVVELQAYLAGRSIVPGVQATPGADTHVPLYLLGSSLFGARLAAGMGLPYAFASHFAPAALEEAVATYRREFRPSEQLDEPHVIAGVNVFAGDSTEEAIAQLEAAKRRRVQLFFGRDRRLTPEEVELVIESPQGQRMLDMLRYAAVGAPAEVDAYLTWFAGHAQADELILASSATDRDARLRTFELVAATRGLVPTG
jgi:luciferase family oxidoreductase group 1